jgi:gas vesicle protein
LRAGDNPWYEEAIDVPDDKEKLGGILPLLGAAAVGAIVGAAAALLLAPKSGAEMREEVKKYAGEAKGKAEDFFKHTVAEKARQVKEQVQERFAKEGTEEEAAEEV